MTPDTLPHLVRLYVRDRRAAGEFAPTTGPGVRRTLLCFAEHSGVAAHAIRGVHVERFLASVPIARSTARQRFSQIRQFARWLVRHDYLADDPTLHLRAPKQPRAVPRAYRAEQVTALLGVCPDPRARLICLLEVQEGMRACEVARLEVGDVDFIDREVVVRGKGGHDRVLPLSAETWGALECYLSWRPATSGPLIRSYNHPREGICPAYLAHMVAGWLRAAGLPGGGHRLRHTMATELLRGGADVRDIQTALGHALLASTAIYLPFSDAKRLRKVMDGRWYGAGRAA
jgi:site-specific recombinase XerD